jgi:hypothetical protein
VHLSERVLDAVAEDEPHNVDLLCLCRIGKG